MVFSWKEYGAMIDEPEMKMSIRGLYCNNVNEMKILHFCIYKYVLWTPHFLSLYIVKEDISCNSRTMPDICAKFVELYSPVYSVFPEADPVTSGKKPGCDLMVHPS